MTHVNENDFMAITDKRLFAHLPHLSKFLSFLLCQRSFRAYFNILSDASMETVKANKQVNGKL